ncbi:MAG: hypothetical protein V4674_01565 [Patescibacteria group bacterium]
MKKTIFISFSAHTVLRNLFLFPGGFWDQCKAYGRTHPEVRFVVLMRKRDIPKYEYLFGGLSKDQFVLEIADVPNPRTVLQRLFRFLYAYLLYTNTTNILTTMGMRQDDPPAVGNRLLAPVRMALAFLGKTVPMIRKKLVPYLHARINPERPFADLFKKYSPKVVFGTHVYGLFDAYLIREARLQGVRSVAMPSGWDHIDKYNLPFQSDLLLVPSPQVRDHAIRFQGYDPEAVEVTGYQHFDYFISKDAYMPREELAKHLPALSSGKYILYVSGSAYCPDEPDIIEEILGWVKEGAFGPDVKLVVRPYLGSRSKDRAFDEAKFARLADDPYVFYYDTKSWDTLLDGNIFLNLIRYAEVVMCVYSTVFLEAALFDRPLVAAPFDGYAKRPLRRSIRRFADFEHFREVLDTGAIKEAYSFPELRTALTDYFNNPSLDADKRERMRKEACYLLDGKASERTLQIVIREMEKATS